MSVYIIDKCERFVSQRAGCGKAASPDSVRGVRPQGVRLLDPILPPVPDKKIIMEDFKKLSGLVGIDSVGWRYDPILPDRDHRWNGISLNLKNGGLSFRLYQNLCDQFY